MFLKKLKIFGFKTFAERTEISFDYGFTAAIGPNGCGKTNILDAIRWVLGESQARRLRGLHMEDVIFSGTEGRKALSMAEVVLVMDNSDKAVPLEFSEIEVTRRLYRSGESECFINRRPCRLRDIQEIFKDTGIGSLSYSVLEQGKVDAVLSAKPQERRTLFEEAAGIAKYKQRKHEALVKLERVQDNLTRLGDILAEVTRQKESLEVQAERAERHIEMAGRLGEQRRLLYYTNYRRLDKELGETRAQLRGREEGLAAYVGRLEKGRLSIEKLQKERNEGEEELEQKREGSFDVGKEKYKKETDVVQFRRQIEDLVTRKKRFLAEIRELQEKLGRLQGGTQGDQQLVLTFGDRRTELVKETRKLEQELGVAEEELERLSLSLADGQTRELERLKRRHRLELELARAAGKLSVSDGWLSDTAGELNDLESRRLGAGREVCRAKAELERRRQEELAKRRQWEKAKGEAERLRAEVWRLWGESAKLARTAEAVQTVTGFAEELKGAGLVPAAAAEIRERMQAELLEGITAGSGGGELPARQVEMEGRIAKLKRRETACHHRLVLLGAETAKSAAGPSQAKERLSRWQEKEDHLGRMCEKRAGLKRRLEDEGAALREKSKEQKRRLARLEQGFPSPVKDAEASERLSELEKKREHLADRVKENRFQLANLQQNHRRARVDLERWRDEEKEHRRRISDRKGEIRKWDKEIAEHKAGVIRAERELGVLLSSGERIEKELTKAQGSRSRLAAALGAMAGKTSRLEGQRTKLDEACQRLRLREVELEGKRQGYRTRLQDECATTPEKLRAEGLRSARGQLAGMSQEVASLKSRLERMGEVNKTAIKELKETKKRYDFMNKQGEDLLKSKQHLLKIIEETEGEARRRFEDTFEKINANFGELFTEFFEGGEAELELVEIEGNEEKGVEIMARPPKLAKSTVNLLSGGQRAMTAIALLFAIFKVKASPFCILDELDAPLDEDNIGKFLKVLDRFLDRTQFVVITHSKLTMEKADVIYGVTMEEKGISKIVSVKLTEAVKA